jgi:hypothetical protein
MTKIRILGLAFILLSLVGLTTASAQPPADVCPQRNFQGLCAQVITFARIPGQIRCCAYANPCVVPPGFVVVAEEDCPIID